MCLSWIMSLLPIIIWMLFQSNDWLISILDSIFTFLLNWARKRRIIEKNAFEVLIIHNNDFIALHRSLRIRNSIWFVDNDSRGWWKGSKNNYIFRQYKDKRQTDIQLSLGCWTSSSWSKIIYKKSYSILLNVELPVPCRESQQQWSSSTFPLKQ